MCYFIHLHIVPEGKADLDALVHELAGRHSIVTRGTFPDFEITNGHCSCSFVDADGAKITVGTFIEELARGPGIKRVEVWWAWAGETPVPQFEERLSVEAFAEQNRNARLAPGVVYRVNDPGKYNRQRVTAPA